jgi:hypothetical protein
VGAKRKKGRIDHCPECGHVFEKTRSRPDHNRLFAIIDRAFDSWPHDHEFRPTSSEHLRAWLLCKANYHTVEIVEIDVDSLRRLIIDDAHTPEMLRFIGRVAGAVARAKLGDDEFAFTKIHGEGIAVFKPKSMSLESMPAQKEFNALRDAVTEIIEVTLGVTAEQLLTARAA